MNPLKFVAWICSISIGLAIVTGVISAIFDCSKSRTLRHHWSSWQVESGPVDFADGTTKSKQSRVCANCLTQEKRFR